MQTYVVRVYRHDTEKSDRVVGVVEEVETGQVWKFRSLDELCSVFCRKEFHHMDVRKTEVSSGDDQN